jgi:hypothetical protein
MRKPTMEPRVMPKTAPELKPLSFEAAPPATGTAAVSEGLAVEEVARMELPSVLMAELVIELLAELAVVLAGTDEVVAFEVAEDVSLATEDASDVADDAVDVASSEKAGWDSFKGFWSLSRLTSSAQLFWTTSKIRIGCSVLPPEKMTLPSGP